MEIALDSNLFLSLVNREPDSVFSQGVLDALEGGDHRGVVSTVVVAEVCTGYHRTGDDETRRRFLDRLTQSPHFRVVPTDVAIADRAGALRAAHRLALPDALIAATALEMKVGTLVSRDAEFRKLRGLLQVVTPQEFLRR